MECGTDPRSNDKQGQCRRSRRPILVDDSCSVGEVAYNGGGHVVRASFATTDLVVRCLNQVTPLAQCRMQAVTIGGLQLHECVHDGIVKFAEGVVVHRGVIDELAEIGSAES